MLNLKNSTRVSIKSIFCVHLLYLFWILPKPYFSQFALVYNLLFFVSLFWATENKESDEPLQFALLINLLSIFFDGSLLILKRREVFETYDSDYGVALIGIVLIRLITSVYLYKFGRARNGAMARMFSKNPVNAGKVEEADDEH